MSKVVFGVLTEPFFSFWPRLYCFLHALVGNVPYNMGEEQLIDVFKSVGQVIGFR